MTCRTGEKFKRALGLADDGGSRRRQRRPADWRTGDRLRLLLMSPRSAESVLSTKVKLEGGCLRSRRAEGQGCLS